MMILSSPTVETETALIVAPELPSSLQDLSSVSPGVALLRPLGDLVQDTLHAACSDSAHSERSYATAIGKFLDFLGEQLEGAPQEWLPAEWLPLAETSKGGKSGRQTLWIFRGAAYLLRAVNAGVLDKFAARLQAEGNGNKTVALRIGAVRTFLSVALRDGVLSKDQAINMGLDPYKKRMRRHEIPTGRRLTPAEVRRLRETVKLHARHDSKAERDIALMDLMLYAGLRRSEISGLLVIDYESEEEIWKAQPLKTGNFRQEGGRWWLTLTGKGGKVRRLKLHDTLYKSLAAWLRRNDLELGQGDELLFYNLNKAGISTGKPLNSSVIGRLVAEYGHLAGLAPAAGENMLSPHDLRRTCARNAFDNGAGLPQIQAMLGHSDVKTTMRYIGAMENDDDTAVDYVRY
jgi:integrase